MAVDCHGCESLVQLNEIDIVQIQVQLSEQFSDRNGRADSHNARSQPVTVAPQNLPMISRLSRSATDRLINMTAAASKESRQF
jgi:hypothetical protein